VRSSPTYSESSRRQRTPAPLRGLVQPTAHHDHAQHGRSAATSTTGPGPPAYQETTASRDPLDIGRTHRSHRAAPRQPSPPGAASGRTACARRETASPSPTRPPPPGHPEIRLPSGAYPSRGLADGLASPSQHHDPAAPRPPLRRALESMPRTEACGPQHHTAPLRGSPAIVERPPPAHPSGPGPYSGVAARDPRRERSRPNRWCCMGSPPALGPRAPAGPARVTLGRDDMAVNWHQARQRPRRLRHDSPVCHDTRPSFRILCSEHGRLCFGCLPC